jgi:hypothetical protein
MYTDHTDELDQLREDLARLAVEGSEREIQETLARIDAVNARILTLDPSEHGPPCSRTNL